MVQEGTVIDFFEAHGQKVRYDQSPAGAARESQPLTVTLWIKPGAYRSGPHIHPEQKEIIDVQEGTVMMKIDGIDHTLTANSEPGIAPAGVPHDFWIVGDKPAVFKITLDPALGFGDFLEIMIGKAHGYPNPLQLGVMMWTYRRENQLPPTIIGRLVNVGLIALAPLGYLLGYRA